MHSSYLSLSAFLLQLVAAQSSCSNGVSYNDVCCNGTLVSPEGSNVLSFDDLICCVGDMSGDDHLNNGDQLSSCTSGSPTPLTALASNINTNAASSATSSSGSSSGASSGEGISIGNTNIIGNNGNSCPNGQETYSNRDGTICCPGAVYGGNNDDAYCCVGADFQVATPSFADCFPFCSGSASSGVTVRSTTQQSCSTTIPLTASDYSSLAAAAGSSMTGGAASGASSGSGGSATTGAGGSATTGTSSGSSSSSEGSGAVVTSGPLAGAVMVAGGLLLAI